MSDAALQIERGLAVLGESYRVDFEQAASEHQLREARARVLGKRGTLGNLLKLVGQLEPEARRSTGDRLNITRAQVEQCFEGRLEALRRAERDRELLAAPADLTLPGRPPTGRGHLHPLTTVGNELLGIFRSLGFEVSWGPEVELENNNFTRLGFPPDHPATDMHDTFWVDVQGASGDERMLLRTHTSPVQVREMMKHQPPMALVSGGRVYRRDDDVTHSPMFHQIEGFWVDRGVNFAHLKGVLTEFVQRLYGEGTGVRFRPSYFPFVEPGAEVDIGCVFCSALVGTRASCRICKGTGWLEVLGCGMIHPTVFRHCGIDQAYTGFAFGLGVERIAMLRYGIPDIRLLFENDPRFLAQF